MKIKKTNWLITPYVIWALAFIIFPLIMIFYYGLTDKSGAFTLSNITSIMETVHIKSLSIAVLLALISTIICLLLSYPPAMILAANKEKYGKAIVFIFILPMWMNFLLRTLAWQTILENEGVINTLLSLVGLPHLEIINTPYAIILGMIYNFLPFMVLPIYNVLCKIDINVINAAKDLGANSFQTFIKVTLPLSLTGIISGITMVFVPSLTTFVVSDLLGGSKILLIGNVIEQEFTLNSNWHLGSGLSIVLMIFIILSMIITFMVDKDGEGNML